MESPLPSSHAAPSIWYEAVAAPQAKWFGNWQWLDFVIVLWVVFKDAVTLLSCPRDPNGSIEF